MGFVHECPHQLWWGHSFFGSDADCCGQTDDDGGRPGTTLITIAPTGSAASFQTNSLLKAVTALAQPLLQCRSIRGRRASSIPELVGLTF